MPQEQEVKSRESRPPREGRGPREGGGGPPRGEGRRDDRRDDRRGDRGFREGPPEIELEKLISDSLYLDNQAHGVVSRMRDMDSGTKSQLRRVGDTARPPHPVAADGNPAQIAFLGPRPADTPPPHPLWRPGSVAKNSLQFTAPK